MEENMEKSGSGVKSPAIENILSRTSDRIFEPGRVVSQDDINTMLHAAMAAPTGCNRRPWHFVVVRDRELLRRLADELPYCKMAKQASLAVVCCGDSERFLEGDDSTLWVQDLSAATENLLLAVHALGLGGVWTALYPHHDRMDVVSEILELPKELVPFNVIPVGYVAKPHTPFNKWDPARITWK